MSGQVDPREFTRKPISTMTENVEIALAAGVPVGEEVKASAFSKSYNTFSGYDIKVLINEKVIAEVQSINATQDENGVTGFIDYVVFQEDDVKSTYFGKEALIVLYAANEYGECAKLIIEDAVFDKWSFGLAIDDLMVTGRLYFKAANVKPWTKIRSS